MWTCLLNHFTNWFTRAHLFPRNLQNAYSFWFFSTFLKLNLEPKMVNVFHFMLPAEHFHSSWFCPHTCTDWKCGGTVRAIKPETTRDFLLNSSSPQYCLTPNADSVDLEPMFCDSQGKIDGASAQKSMQTLCHSNARKPWGGRCGAPALRLLLGQKCHQSCLSE